ncbi:hypothetical protein [uncultured Tenacibaculum sp.]|uniref:hypothetical protein n=1 Tax=uncultured Tenacibaculum sp. TaxID=174713 RepID=UPI00262434F6|nr:hypothetical protein [uncultured Tenacibaculum sp.]
MQILHFIKYLFQPSKKYKRIWPIQIYILKLFFLLMFVFAAKDAWTELITHKGDWNPEIAVAWCSIAAYTTLSGLGIFNTLKMLPIMLFMIFYKGLWLFFVAYPLWKNGTLVNSEAQDWTQIFILIIVPITVMPWKYVFKTFVLSKD